MPAAERRVVCRWEGCTIQIAKYTRIKAAKRQSRSRQQQGGGGRGAQLYTPGSEEAFLWGSKRYDSGASVKEVKPEADTTKNGRCCAARALRPVCKAPSRRGWRAGEPGLPTLPQHQVVPVGEAGWLQAPQRCKCQPQPSAGQPGMKETNCELQAISSAARGQSG